MIFDNFDNIFQMQEQKTADSKPQQQQKQEIREDEEIPDHFYDSDLASVNEKDFQSDNEPPQDMVRERKLLHKEKMLHIFKTILKVGEGFDRPAAYDRIQLRFRQKQSPEQDPTNKDFLHEMPWLNYNLGMEHEEIERLVTSMKRKETSMFEMEQLEISKKSNIKILKSKRTFTIQAVDWTTVIDIDGDRRILKEVENKGLGHYRVQKYDEIEIAASIMCNEQEVWKLETSEGTHLKLENQVIDEMHQVIWRILSSMKSKEKVRSVISDEHFQEMQNPEYYSALVDEYKRKTQIDKQNQQLEWIVRIQVLDVIKVDDIYLDGGLLKTTLVKGISTARADSSSLVYYALKFFDGNRKLIHEDKCFQSDWWEDFSKLDELGCRKSYLDDYSVSKMLKATIQRTKPAEIALIQCRDSALFQYGSDYDELKQLLSRQNSHFPPSPVFMELRVYNFMEGKTCFNMNIEEKVKESKRLKQIGHKLLKQGRIKKAYQIYQSIVSLYSAGDIDTDGYEEKVSGLMNSTLCLMKMESYTEMLSLCDQVLETPRHGYNPDQVTIKGPQHGAKIQGQLKNANPSDSRKEANVSQNKKIIDKCLYRKAFALNKLGENAKAIVQLQKIEEITPEVSKLRVTAEKSHEVYQQKSKKIFKSMFE